MNSRRTLIIVVALLLAGLAFVGNLMWLKGVRDRAYDNAEKVKIYQVKKDIPKGLTGEKAIDDKYIESTDIPREFYPGSAIKNINDIRSKLAVAKLPVGAVVLNDQFVPPNEAVVTVAQNIDPKNVAVTVSIDQVSGVAGLLMPGDIVDIIVLGEDKANGNGYAQVLYQNVKIMAIGSKTAPQAGDTSAQTKNQADASSGLITFVVPLEAAQHIALASNGSGGTKIQLALVPPKNEAIDPPASTMSNKLFENLPRTPYDN